MYSLPVVNDDVGDRVAKEVMFLSVYIFTARKRSCRKVMFSQVCS